MTTATDATTLTGDPTHVTTGPAPATDKPAKAMPSSTRIKKPSAAKAPKPARPAQTLTTATTEPRPARPAATGGEWRPTHLGELQRLVLVSLPAKSVTELAERLDVTRPSASRALHSLLGAKLVQPANGKTGGWKTPWELTKLGKRLAQELSFDSVRRIHEQLANRPTNLPADAEAILGEAEERLGSLIA